MFLLTCPEKDRVFIFIKGLKLYVSNSLFWRKKKHIHEALFNTLFMNIFAGLKFILPIKTP